MNMAMVVSENGSLNALTQRSSPSRTTYPKREVKVDPGDDDEQYSLQERNQYLCVEALARADWNGFVLSSSESAGGYALRRRGVSVKP